MTRKTKTIAKPAAQSREEAEQLIARIGIVQRELQRQDANLGDEIAKVKEAAETKAKPLKDELADAEGRVARWCEANRKELTRDGKIKTATLHTGVVSWRHRPPKVSLRGVKAEDVVAWLLEPADSARFHLRRIFIRTKFELNKDAMLDHVDDAKTIPGVSIGSAGEDFIIEPFGGEKLEGAAA